MARARSHLSPSRAAPVTYLADPASTNNAAPSTPAQEDLGDRQAQDYMAPRPSPSATITRRPTRRCATCPRCCPKESVRCCEHISSNMASRATRCREYQASREAESERGRVNGGRDASVREEADRQRVHRRREERDAHAGVRRAKGHWSRFAAVRRFTSERVSGVRELEEVVGEVSAGA